MFQKKDMVKNIELMKTDLTKVQKETRRLKEDFPRY